MYVFKHYDGYDVKSKKFHNSRNHNKLSAYPVIRGDLPGIGEWRLCEPKNLIYGNCNMDYDNKNMVGYDIFIHLMMVKENMMKRTGL